MYIVMFVHSIDIIVRVNNICAHKSSQCKEKAECRSQNDQSFVSKHFYEFHLSVCSTKLSLDKNLRYSWIFNRDECSSYPKKSINVLPSIACKCTSCGDILSIQSISSYLYQLMLIGFFFSSQQQNIGRCVLH